jgi:hypothetical protein
VLRPWLSSWRFRNDGVAGVHLRQLRPHDSGVHPRSFLHRTMGILSIRRPTPAKVPVSARHGPPAGRVAGRVAGPGIAAGSTRGMAQTDWVVNPGWSFTPA